MSKDEPIYGVDISGWQRGIDLAQVAREGYEFCVVKATEGPTHDGWIFTNPHYETQLAAAKAAGLVVGSYHFLVEGPPEAQVDHFLETVGDPTAQLIMVDFEEYSNRDYPHYDPTNATLKAFVDELQQRIGSRPVLLYSGQGYWNAGTPSGEVSQYGEDLVTWDAFYPVHPQAGLGSALYERVKDLGWGERWGNREPKIWQFSANGRVAGMEIDVNAFSGTRAELYALADAEAPDRIRAPMPVQPPSEQRLHLGVDPADGALYERDSDTVRRVVVSNPDQTPIANTTLVTDEHGQLRLVRLDGRHPVVEIPELPADAVPITHSDASMLQARRRPLAAGLQARQRKRIAHPGSGWYANTYPTHHDWNDDVYRLVLKYEAQYAGIYLNTYYMHPPVFGRKWEFRSFDVWDVAGRGYALDPDLGDEVHRTIMGDLEPPWIAWIIYKGIKWDPVRGKVPWDLQPDDGSDFGHWRHIHVTFAFP
jgi:GH25 family lysozyme M1 (1,4-beta-N-acetylmuramidase)